FSNQQKGKMKKMKKKKKCSIVPPRTPPTPLPPDICIEAKSPPPSDPPEPEQSVYAVNFNDWDNVNRELKILATGPGEAIAAALREWERDNIRFKRHVEVRCFQTSEPVILNR